MAAKAAAADATRNQKSANDAIRRQQQEADDAAHKQQDADNAARKQQDADDAAQKQKVIDNGVPGKNLLDGAALMQFQKLNKRDSDTHLDRAELGHLDEAIVRKMDANKDGTVGVMELMQHGANESGNAKARAAIEGKTTAPPAAATTIPASLDAAERLRKANAWTKSTADEAKKDGLSAAAYQNQEPEWKPDLRGSVSRSLSKLSQKASTSSDFDGRRRGSSIRETAESPSRPGSFRERDYERSHSRSNSTTSERRFSMATPQPPAPHAIDPYLRVFEHIKKTTNSSDDIMLTLPEIEANEETLREHLPELFTVLDQDIAGLSEEHPEARVTPLQIMTFFDTDRSGEVTVLEFMYAAKRLVDEHNKRLYSHQVFQHKSYRQSLHAAALSPEMVPADVITSPPLQRREIAPQDADFEKAANLPTLPARRPAPEPEPLWLHPQMSREEAEEMMTTFDAEEGDFLVRVRNKETKEYSLVVLYKGRFTHHVCAQEADGNFLVNKKPCPVNTLMALIKRFSAEVSGWPVVLNRGIGPFGAIDDVVLQIDANAAEIAAKYAEDQATERARMQSLRRKITENETRSVNAVKEQSRDAQMTGRDSELGRAQLVAASASKQIMLVKQFIEASIRTLAGVSTVEWARDSPSYLHVDCKMRRSRDMLEGRSDGHYLVRKHPEDPNRFLMDVIYQGEFTSHAVHRSGGRYLLNDSEIQGCKSIDDLVFSLRTASQSWPVALRHPVRDPRKCPPRVPGYASGEDPEDPSYIWGIEQLSRRNAAKLLADEPTGVFVVRRDTSAPRTYLLGIMHNGTFTQHTVKARSDTGPYLVNGNRMGGHTTIDGVIEYLRIARENWPVAITTAIRPKGATAPEPPGFDDEITMEMEEHSMLLQLRLVERKRLSKIAHSRVETIAGLGPGDTYTAPPDEASDLYELDLEYTKLSIVTLEAALQESVDALAEIRHYDAIGASLPGGFIEQDPEDPSYLWPKMKKAEANAQLDGLDNGSFMLIGKGPSYTLALVFDHDVTYHAVRKDRQQGYLVSGMTMGGKQTLDGLVRFLSNEEHCKQANWPCVLSHPLRNPMQPKPESEALRLAAADVARIEGDLDAAKDCLFSLNSGAVVKGSTNLSLKVVDARQVVPDKIKRHIGLIEAEINASYAKIVGATLPVLTDDHADVLLQVVQTKVAELVDEELYIADLSKALSPRYRALFALDSLAKKARAARNFQRQLNEFLDPTKTTNAAAAKQIAAQIAELKRNIDLSKEDLKKLEAAMEKLMELTSDPDATDLPKKIGLVKEYAVKKSAEMHELQMINANGTLSTFYVVVLKSTADLIKRMRVLVAKRAGNENGGLKLLEGVESALGFLPVPAFGKDAVAHTIFARDSPFAGVDSARTIQETAEKFALMLTVRFEEQVQMLNAFEAARFARWFVKPLLVALVNPPNEPQTVEVDTGGELNGIMDTLRVKEVVKRTAQQRSSFRIAEAPPGSQLRIGDTLVKIKTTKIHGLTLDELKSLLQRHSTKEGGTITLSIARTVDFEVSADPANLTTRTAEYFVRTIDGWDDKYRIEEFTDDAPDLISQLKGLHDNAFNSALHSDIMGGKLWLDSGSQAGPAEIVAKCGLVTDTGTTISGVAQKEYYSTDGTDVSKFGYRCDVAGLYISFEDQGRQMRWEKALCMPYRHDEDPPETSLFLQMETSGSRPGSALSGGGRSISVLSQQSSGSRMVSRAPSRGSLWTPQNAQQVDDLEMLAQDKAREAEALRLEVLQMKEKMAAMAAENLMLTRQVNARSKAKTFKSSLHTGSRA